MKELLSIGVLCLVACSGGGGGGSVLPVSPASNVVAPKTIAVLGDSISKTVILPDSPIPCGWPTNATCDYSHDPSKAYPAQVATALGDNVVNLANPGAWMTSDTTNTGTIPSLLTMVPQVPTNSSYVVIEGGTNDVSALNGKSINDALLAEIDTVTAAVRKRAPNAKLIFIGLRYFSDCPQTITPCGNAVDAWNTHEQQVAASVGGTFIDLRPLWPAQSGPDWPDGIHPGPNAVSELAKLVEGAIP